MITITTIISKSKCINDGQIRNALATALLKNKPHSARIITEQLREKFPKDRDFMELDTLVTEKYFG